MNSRPRIQATTPRVAVIDDELDVRESICIAIKSINRNLSCVCYGTAESFLADEPISQHSCVIVDIRLPGTSGLELLPVLQHRGFDAPIIVTSGQACVADVVFAFQNRASAFFEKPVPLDELVRTTARLVRQYDDTRHKRADAEEASLRLTQRERQVMQLLLDGEKTVQIAKTLRISPSTVEKHRLNIFEKTRTGSVVELVHFMSCIKPTTTE